MGALGTEDYLMMVWFAVSDDTIGGWAVATRNQPVSQHGFNNDTVSLAHFTDENLARHIAYLHNRWLVNTRTGRGQP